MTTNHGNWPSSCLVQFKNCTILRDHKLIQEDLWVRNCLIINPEPIFYEERATADIQVDCKGAIISPGYIDLQINGGMGVDFSHNVDIIGEAVAKVAKGVLPFGVTSICPTIVTSTPDVYHKALSTVQKCNGSANGAGILGLHLEGPFISKHKKGAHKAQLIQSLDNGLETVTKTYGPLDNVAIITVAPELDVEDTVIPSLVKRGITVSIGHSEANLVQGEKAIQRGASFITHLFNAMLPFHHRDPGLVGLLTSKKLPEEKHIFYGIIADGIHTHPAALRIAYKTDARGLTLVTDAMSAMGLEAGVHFIGENKVEIVGKRAVIAGTSTLCGSIATMDFCVRFLQKSTGCSTVEALESASLHPAEVLGIADRKGTLDFGAEADFVMLDGDLHVTSTWIAGKNSRVSLSTLMGSLPKHPDSLLDRPYT
ncbi:hypothetical protein HPB47_021564 [Ixodes persulcatus]|uniref:Uncharacterized protein n=1 Tax=Ixodes persulcatus TaxID=34615 RepID=A0AC60QEJ8_IXOPE|nr:hypothetical protein HPB47_021564 [Ixodes persulcatus]